MENILDDNDVTIEGFLKINRATDWESFLHGSRFISGPVENWNFAEKKWWFLEMLDMLCSNHLSLTLIVFSGCCKSL